MTAETDTALDDRVELEHRDHRGSISRCPEDGVLHGRVLGVRDIVFYEGENLENLEAAFVTAVDEYLAR